MDVPEELYRRWLAAIGNGKVDAHHPDAASTMHELARCAIKARRSVQAEECLRRALVLGKERLGADYTDVADTMRVVAKCAQDAKEFSRYLEVTSAGVRMLAILVHFLSIDHPIIANSLKSLCSAQESMQESMYTSVFFLNDWLEAIQDKPRGIDDHSKGYTLHSLGETAMQVLGPEGGKEFQRQARTLLEEAR